LCKAAIYLPANQRQHRCLIPVYSYIGAFKVPTNVPQTAWQPTDGLSDYDSGGVFNIADPSGNLLVDPSGSFIVDTGVIVTMIPNTTWTTDDST
jgi:hypothetical protein